MAAAWQPYIDSSLLGSGHVDQAAILDAGGRGVWAQSAGFKFNANELKVIAASFVDKSDPKQIQANGFHLLGQKYMTIAADNEVLVGKKGKEGVICVKTTQALIVAHHGENALTNNARSTVEGVGNYLKSVGY